MPAPLRALNAEAGPVPQEALDFFEAKELRPGFSHLDVWGEEHTRAFTAAKFMREDVLAVMQASLATALREGHTYEQWARGLQPELERLGFWGQQRVVDPLTGREVEISVPHRLEHIFRQNMRTARAAGQWERIQRTKTALPYLLYLLGPSERHRPEHAALHGLLLPVDDPFWQTHFPPNAHGCKCFVRQVTSREADRVERDGIRSGERTVVLDADGNPTGRRTTTTVPVRRVAPPLEFVPFENKRTGQIEMVPRGIDPGFAHPPSQLRNFQGGPNRPPTATAAPVVPALPAAPAAPAAPPTPPRRRTRTPADPSAPSPARRTRVPKATPATPLDEEAFAELRAQVFAGDETVPRRMDPREMGRLLEEALATADGGARMRRITRAIVRMHAGVMLREGTTTASGGDTLLFARLGRGVEGSHQPATGRIQMRSSARAILARAGKALAAGKPLTDAHREALHTLLHETMHAFGWHPSDIVESVRLKSKSIPGKGVEETVAETLSRQLMRDVFGAAHRLPNLRTGVDTLPYYSRLLKNMMMAISVVGERSGSLPSESAADHQARVEGLLEAAARVMRQRDPLVLPPPAPPPPANGFVWAFVDSIPFAGNADQARQAREDLYRIIADPGYLAGSV